MKTIRDYKKILICIFFIIIILNNTNGFQQELLKEFIISDPKLIKNAILPDPKKAMIIVNSTIPDLKFESNMGAKVKNKGGGIWQIELIPGPNILTIMADGFKTAQKLTTLEKNRAYSIEIKPDMTQQPQQSKQIYKPPRKQTPKTRPQKKITTSKTERDQKKRLVPEIRLGTELFYDYSAFDNELFYKELKITPYANYHDGIGGGVSLNFKYFGIGFKYSNLIIKAFDEQPLNYFGSSSQFYAKFNTSENNGISIEAGLGYLWFDYKIKTQTLTISTFKRSIPYCLLAISLGSSQTRIFGETNLKINQDGTIHNLYNRVGLRFYRNTTSTLKSSNTRLNETRFRIFYDLNYRTSLFKQKFWKQQLGDLPNIKQNDCIGGGIGLGRDEFRAYFNIYVIYDKSADGTNSINGYSKYSSISGRGYQTYAQSSLFPNSFISPVIGGGYYWFQYIVNNESKSIVWENNGPFGILGLSLGRKSFHLFGESDIVIKDGAIAIFSIRSGIRISFTLGNK